MTSFKQPVRLCVFFGYLCARLVHMAAEWLTDSADKLNMSFAALALVCWSHAFMSKSVIELNYRG